jgi:hypothetical protein
VSDGVSLAPTWTATGALKLSLEISRENHDYIDSSPSAIALASRRDEVTTEHARLLYTPTDYLTLDLTFGYDQRSSNQRRFQYDDTLATASLTYKIRP